ncbi:D-alanyl-D-alanine carboxypeptidase [Alkalihalobacillus alcalophilus ATCC 27647 = CGMCC 1.3604]|uniref:D-alanyl-D-alanine carboxypeptidase n=2 Tax=Alkalihalobacillus alcalophilus ATCC 27647 = CGMCC 1.3604 TaxID=1218173 RepID=A0A4S4JVU7_ALKAL|nr:D-alanyl-D-alanine carboxypeptidase family protein [Alkalihalobacillus alcalophilus]MED1561179.1 D-alanyl-D-alanine carboxypeptidase [Alkalihalobacillus alcalophilus]THG89264.1 D-alanyl-D-alanine carboxypeptidase [Alkalihalobacillus alcalophilus ATCC 27647 = CGMCC 1.3604]
MVTRIMKQLMIVACLSTFFIYGNGVKAESNKPFQLNSEVALLIDQTSGDLVYEQFSTQKMYPASITKIITGIIAIEQGNLDDIVTISKEATEVIGTRVYLLEDEEVTLKKLVQGLLINSGNDAGTAIAEHFDGSEEAFAKRMNEFVTEEIGTVNTNFTNPHGLFDEEHYTTALDMARITQYAMKNETFREIVSTKELEWLGEGWETTIYNHHRLLWDYEGTTGVKNGFVSQSGYTLVTSAERDNQEFIAVTLKAPNAKMAYQDTMKLLNYGFENYHTKMLPEDKRFQGEDGEELFLEKDLYFTQLLDESVDYEVNQRNQLEIKGQEDRTIKRVDLKTVDVEPVQTKAEIDLEAAESKGILGRMFDFLVQLFSFK